MERNLDKERTQCKEKQDLAYVGTNSTLLKKKGAKAGEVGKRRIKKEKI